MAPSLMIASFQSNQQRLVSVCIPHKENLVKPSLAYFTSMVRAPEECAVRRNGLRLFNPILWSRSWCCLIRELVESLNGDTELPWSNRGCCGMGFAV